MAKKKNFKSGLSNVIEESLNILSDEPSSDSKAVEELKTKIEKLENHIKLLKRELYFWRTGKLTVEKFNESLAQHGLKYDPNTNSIIPLNK